MLSSLQLSACSHPCSCLCALIIAAVCVLSSLQLFVCCDAEDFQKDFQDSLMVNVLERHANTINILITVPPPRPPLASKARSLSDSAFNPPSTDEQNPCTKVLNPDMDSVQDSTKAGLGECEDILSEQKTMPQLVQRTDGTAEGASPQSGAGVAAAEGRSADVVDASDSDTCEQEEGGADVSGAVGVMSTSGSARTIVSSDWGVANSIKATSTDPDTKLESRGVSQHANLCYTVLEVLYHVR